MNPYESQIFESLLANKVDEVKFCLNCGFPINHTFKPLNETLLHRAAIFGLTEMTVMLLDLGANIEALDIGRNTPLHQAVSNDRRSITNILLARGAEQSYNSQGKMPIHIASEERHLECLQLLFDNGVDVENIP